jgi:hypothetical protein
MTEKLISINDISANTGYTVEQIKSIAKDLGLKNQILYTQNEYTLIRNHEFEDRKYLIPTRIVETKTNTWYVFPSKMNWDKSI